MHFYLAAAELAARLTAGRTRGEVVAEDQAEFYAAAPRDPAAAAAAWDAARLRREVGYLAETRRPGERRDDSDLSGGGYQHVALDLVTALTGGPPARLIVNAPNAPAGPAAGPALPQLPPDLVVEAPCRVDASGAQVLPTAPLELHQLGLVAAVRAAERAVIEAVSTGSREAALRAFVIHPLAGSPNAAGQVLSGLLADEPELAALLR